MITFLRDKWDAIFQKKKKPDLRERRQKPKQTKLKHLFPVQEGDVIEFTSGKIYRVVHIHMTGCIRISSYYLKQINEPVVVFKQEQTEHYDTLRELNYHLIKAKKEIVTIKPANPMKRMKPLSIDECYDMAIKQDQMRNKLKQFMKESVR